MLSGPHGLRPISAIAIVICSAVVSAAIVAALDSQSGSSNTSVVTGHATPLELPPVSGSTRRADPAAPPRGQAEPTTQHEIGQMLMTGMEGAMPDARLLAEVRSGDVGGIILFGANVTSSLPAALRALQGAARAGHNPPLLIATDQEGGQVKRFPEGPPEVPTRAISTPAEAFEQGRLTGEYLYARGVNVDLAPVSDVSGAQDFERAQARGFRGGPNQVAALATQFARGLEKAHVAATAKHFPGIGALPRDTDEELQSVEEPAAVIHRQMRPFAREVDAGIKLVMVANAMYPAVDQTAPASMSPVIQQQILRGELGFNGVIITDALDDPPQLPGSIGERAVYAAIAGASVILLSNEQDGPPASRALRQALRTHAISRAGVQSAYQRVVALKQWLAEWKP